MNKDLRNVRLLSYVPFGLNKFHNQVDVAIAHAVKGNGGEALIFQCDGIYKNCEVFNRSQNSQAERAAKCADCQNANKSFFAEVGFVPLQIRESLEVEDFAIAQRWAQNINRLDFLTAKYEGIPIGEWTVSSICTMFRVSGDEIFEPQYESAYREFLEGTLLTYLGLKRVFNVYKPTHVLAFNARLSVLRVLLELAIEFEIPCLTHDKAFAEGTWNFYLNDHVVNLRKYHAFIRLWKDIPLSKEECEKVNKLFFARETGEGLNILKIVNFDSRQIAIRQRLGIPENVKILGYFTSSESEISWLPEFYETCDQYQLLEKLISIYSQRDDYLVIRHHPLLSGKDYIFPEKGGLSRFEKITSNLPSNIINISPADTLSSYALLEECDAVISPASTIAIEAMIRGIPTAVLPKSYFHDVGTILITDDSESYINTIVDQLFNFDGMLPLDAIKSIFRHESIRMERMGLKFESATYEMKNYTPTMLCHFKSENDIKNISDPGLEKILEFLSSGKSFWPQPTFNEITSSGAEENEFLKTFMEGLIKKRVAKKTQKPSNIVSLPKILGITNDNKEFLNFPNISYINNDIISENIISNHDYFVIRNGNITYDKGFVWSAIDLFSSESATNVQGIMHGTWLRSKGKLLNSIFSSHRAGITDPILSFEKEVRTSVEIILSLILFKSSALNIVQQILSMKDENEKIQAAYTFILSDLIKRSGLTLAWYEVDDKLIRL